MEKETIFLEVRGAAGGDEAKIWASDLMRMYFRYCQKQNISCEQIEESTLKIKGYKIFDFFKNESGVHRVQRIPATEKRGRIHTSTATILVLPQISDREINISESDLEWQFYRAGGKGGQNVNKVSTAVRLIHQPTGITVTAQTERQQEQNRANALDLLRSKLWEREELEKEKKIEGYRSKVKSGDRSDKIRTYNFPQDRVTDHRIGKSFGNLESIIDGNLDKIFENTKDLN